MRSDAPCLLGGRDGGDNCRLTSLDRRPMEPLTDATRRAVLSEFLDFIENGRGLLPAPTPLPYDPVPAITSAAWSIFIAEEMVAGELRELTNQINQWLGSLRRWHAWNKVLAAHGDETRWEIEWEWIEPLAFHCMFQPSGTRDRFIMVATNALHQVRMAVDPTIKDELLGDPATPEDRCTYPSRRDKEKQLKGLAKLWPTGKAFIQALGQVDDVGYKRLTSDFRNRASHGIAPRFSVGYTAMVTRQRQQATKMEQQPDGTYKDVPVPNKMATSYGFGGTPPLSMMKAWETNRAQFERARHAFDAYVALLTEATAAMPKRPEPVGKSNAPVAQQAAA
jgi:hypothetical protein